MNPKNSQIDPSSFIMRNPYESLSASKQSSKFYEPSNPLQVTQFDSANNASSSNLYDRKGQEQTHNKQMKYVYSFYNPQPQPTDNHAPSQIPNPFPNRKENPTKLHPEFNYPERLTFENQSVSPFTSIQTTSKNPQEQNEFRHSFNPLQTKVNQLEKMCKQLYDLSLQQNHKNELDRNSMVRIQQKIDYLMEFFQNHQEQKLCNKIATRSSNENRKPTSIPQQSNHSKKARQTDFLNSSEKLSRYLEPPSSQQINFKKIDERSVYNNSKGAQSHRTKNIKPFIVNSDLQNESSIYQIHHSYPKEFNEDEGNKQNFNSSNFIIYENVREYNPMKKKNYMQSEMESTRQRQKNSYEKASKQRKPTEKEIKSSKNKTQELRKLQNSQDRIQKYKNQPEENKVIIRHRAKSQNTTNRKRAKEENNNKKTYYEVSVTAPNVDYEERERNKALNASKIYDGSTMQTSAIFQAVQFPSNTYKKRPLEMKQSVSSELPRQKRKQIIQNNNKTLLESIEEKKQLIDRQLSKRLMKNAALLHGGSTNLLIAKEH